MTKFMNVEAKRASFESVNGVAFLALESGLTKCRIMSVVSSLMLDNNGSTNAGVCYEFKNLASNATLEYNEHTLPQMYASVEDYQAGRAMALRSFKASALVKGKSWATVSYERDEDENELVRFSVWENNGNGPVELNFEGVALIRIYDENGKDTESWNIDGVHVFPGVDVFATREDCLNMTPFVVVDENGTHTTPARLEYLMMTEEQKDLVEALQTAVANLRAGGLELCYNDYGFDVINVSNLTTERPEVAEGEPQPEAVNFADIFRVSAKKAITLNECSRYYRKSEAPANANA